MRCLEPVDVVQLPIAHVVLDDLPRLRMTHVHPCRVGRAPLQPLQRFVGYEVGPLEAVLMFSEDLGAGAGEALTNRIAIREAAAGARLVVCLEPDSRINQPMLRLLGVDAIVVGPFDPLATLAALAPSACPPTEASTVYGLEPNAA